MATAPRKALVDVLALREVSAFASDYHHTRPELCGVHVEIEPDCVTYVATDGRRLIAYREPLYDDWPKHTLVGAFTLPTKACRALTQKATRSHAILTEANGTLGMSLGYGASVVNFEPITHRFPDWREPYPIGPTSGVVHAHNLKMLADFAKFAFNMGMTIMPGIAHNGGDKPSRITFDTMNATGLIMPMIEDGPADVVRPWAVPRLPNDARMAA